jgi:hypothetical protein
MGRSDFVIVILTVLHLTRAAIQLWNRSYVPQVMAFPNSSFSVNAVPGGFEWNDDVVRTRATHFSINSSINSETAQRNHRQLRTVTIATTTATV